MLTTVTLLGAFVASSAQEYKTPYVTDKTVFIKKDVHYGNLQPVSDGKFTLIEYNRAIGYGSYWSSWTIDGYRLYGPEWEQYGREKPMWDSGVLVVKDPKVKLPVILYDDCKIKEFRKTCSQVSQFVDGMAMVIEQSEEGNLSYYIDKTGEKIMPHLAESGVGYRSSAVVRPVKCGLRAYLCNKTSMWGYLDESGQVVIEPKFHDVRDFVNGYALVITKNGDSAGHLSFIDKSGNEVRKPIYEGSVYLMSSASFISDIDSKGNYYVSDRYGDSRKFYNVKSEGEINYAAPVFSPSGAYVTVDNKIVYDASGKIVLQATDGGKIGDFCDEGYAPFYGNVPTKGGDLVEMTGYCRPTGEIVLAFCKPGVVVVPIKEDTSSRIKGKTPREKAKYDVKVVAHPQNGGVVYGTGKYHLGDTIRVTGTPAKDYSLAGINSTKLLKKTKQFNRFVVNGDGVVTCYFVDDVPPEEPTVTGGYLGSLPMPLYNGDVIDVPVWLEISKDKDVKSPYGDNTYGYLSISYDPSKMLHVRNQGSKDGEVFLNYFMAPMLVTGIYKDPFTRKNYLMLEGGEVLAGNIIVKENNVKTGKVDNMKTGLANLMLLFDRFTEIKITPARYRVELLYGNIGDESFTFGQLERLSVEHGWLPGAHEVFTQRKKGLFVRSKTAGLPSQLFQDRKMQFSDKKPQIWWYPTLEFYGGKDEDGFYEKIVKNLGETYREFVSDIDMFKNADFSDFVLDLENNVFKCNNPEN